MELEQLKALQAALAPIVRYIEINDGDTLLRITPDQHVVATASGSWAGSTTITLGNLRKIAEMARTIATEESIAAAKHAPPARPGYYWLRHIDPIKGGWQPVMVDTLHGVLGFKKFGWASWMAVSEAEYAGLEWGGECVCSPTDKGQAPMKTILPTDSKEGLPATSGCGPSTGSAVFCISAGCTNKEHAAQWLYEYPRMAWFPMCDRARHRLMEPEKDGSPGISADSFTPLDDQTKEPK